MNSEIKLDTEVGKGSNFYFTLNLAYLNQQDKASTVLESAAEDLFTAKLLLVEDTPFNILFTKQLLEGWNTIVDVAENGAIAVDMVNAKQYDLVVMDLHMPIMDGYTSAKRIREFDQRTPIIALTAFAAPEIEEKIQNAGMQDYITKPFNPDTLFLKIRNLISHETNSSI